VLAIVIGDKAEDAFRQSMLMSKGSLDIFFANRLVTSLVVAGIVLLLLPLVLQLVHLLRKPAPAAAKTNNQEKAII
jgi:putative tricarboxylic transport membrane protein